MSKIAAFFVCVYFPNLLGAMNCEASPVDTAAFLRIYLTSAELPWMTNSKDDRLKGDDDDDTSFVEHHGLLAGMNIWNATVRPDTIDRLVDIHWLFPDTASAEAYINETWTRNAEGAPHLDLALRVGDNSQAFGGPLTMGGMKMVWYYYIFRVGRVVSKVFVSQSVEYPSPVLTIGRAYTIANEVVSRIRAAHL